MQPRPRSSLEVIQPEFLLELLVPLLDRPAAMRQGYQPGDGSILGEVGDVVLVAVRPDPLDEQPPHGAGAIVRLGVGLADPDRHSFDGSRNWSNG